MIEKTIIFRLFFIFFLNDRFAFVKINYRFRKRNTRFDLLKNEKRVFKKDRYESEFYDN